MGNTWARYWGLQAEPFERVFLDHARSVTEERWRELVALSAALPPQPDVPCLDLEEDPLAIPPPHRGEDGTFAQVVFRGCLVTCGGGAVLAAYDVIHDMDPNSDDLSGILPQLQDRRDAAAIGAWKRFLCALGWVGEGPRPSPLPWWIPGVYPSDHWLGLSSPRELADLWRSFTACGLDALLRARRPELAGLVDLFDSATRDGRWLLAVESCC